MNNDSIISERHLEDKSKLVFHFNQPAGPGYMVKTLSFMENIEIDERVATNYAQYTPIGSNGSQFAYLGSKSREFEISFNITLPHIMEGTLVRPNAKSLIPSKTIQQKSFFESNIPNVDGPNPKTGMAKFIQYVDQQHNLLLSDRDKIIEGALKIQKKDTVRETALIKVMYWVNLIRSSCLTNAKKPYLGPPIVRLHHGILYSDVPCIVNNYIITYDQMNGFDAKTMLPRVISVKLSLKEVRLRGEEFSPGLPSGDYMPGWNSMFVENEFVTLDPNIPGWAS